MPSKKSEVNCAILNISYCTPKCCALPPACPKQFSAAREEIEYAQMHLNKPQSDCCFSVWRRLFFRKTLSTDRQAPAVPMIRGTSMIPRTSSNPKVFRGARFTALTYPANATHAAGRVAHPTVSNSAARRLTSASNCMAVVVCVRKYQLQCQG